MIRFVSKTKIMQTKLFIVAFFLMSSLASFGQETEEFSIPFAFADRPGKVIVEIPEGSITIRAYYGSEVKATIKAENSYNPGMRKGVPGLSRVSKFVDAQMINNEVRINPFDRKAKHDVTLQVPRNTSLQINTQRKGDVVVEGVNGELEIENMDGSIILRDISGSVIANTYNGDIKCDFVQVSKDVPMAFTTYQGNIEVQLPAGINADIRVKDDKGRFRSQIPLAVTNGDSENVKKVSDNTWEVVSPVNISAKLGNGGAEIRFKTSEGNIIIKE